MSFLTIKILIQIVSVSTNIVHPHTHNTAILTKKAVTEKNLHLELKIQNMAAWGSVDAGALFE